MSVARLAVWRPGPFVSERRCLRALVLALTIWWLPVPCRGAQVSSGLDPNKALTQFGLETWTTDQGLPNATVNAVLQSREGYVWLATYDGLARFDGSRFTVFDQSHGLGNNGVRALCVDADESLWVGTTGGGVARLSRGRFTRFTTADGLPSDIVWSLHADTKSSGVWIGTHGGGLARIRDGRVERYPIADSGRDVLSIEQADDGTLWLGAQADGVRRLDPDGRWTAYTTADGLPAGLVTGVALGKDGTLWGGTSTGLFLIRGGRVVDLPPGADALRTRNVTCLLEDDTGTLWVGTNGSGLARYSQGQVSFLGSQDGLGDVVYALRMDQGGALWIGTNGAGVSRLRDGSFTTYTTREGLSRDLAYTSFQDRTGVLWVGTAGGLDRLEGARFVPASPPVERPVAVRSIAEGAGGTLWIGTYGAGVWRRLDGRWRSYTTKDGLASDNVRAVLVDRAGRVWAATIAGLSLLEGEVWRSFRIAEGLPTESLIGLAEDRDGALWFGTDGSGLVRFREGRFDTFTTKNGLASNLVLCVSVDADGKLWVGTNGGLSLRRGGDFFSFARAPKPLSDAVTQIAEDALGSLWIGSSKGTSRVSKVSLERHAQNQSIPLDILSFDRGDGMKSAQCTAPGEPAGMRGRDGRLWFATTRGVATVDPTRLRLDEKPPAVVLEEVTIDGGPVPFDTNVVVPPGSARVGFRFAALSLLASKRTSVRFRLEGLDADWIDSGDRHDADYTGLPPGDYVFRAAARTSTRPWSAASVAIPVRVLPRFYQTRLFALVSALALIGFVGLGHQLRVRELRDRERRLTGLVVERTRSLEQEKERAEEARSDAVWLLAERERIEAELRRRDSYLVSLHETALLVMDRLETGALLHALVERAAMLLEAPDGFLYLETPDMSRLECRVWFGSRPRDQFAMPDEGAVGRAWKRGEVVAIDNYDQWPGRSPLVAPGIFGAKLAVPLRIGGYVRGALGVARSPGAAPFGADERQLLESLGRLASIALDNARLYGAVTDELAERTRTQAELARSEARYRDLFEQSVGLICTHDLQGTLLSVNPAAAEALGRTTEELAGHQLQEFLPPESRPAFARYLEKIRKDRSVAGAMVILNVKSERRTWRYRNVLRDPPEGAPFVIGFAQDVTEEETFQAALRESEGRFRQLAENVDAVFSVRSTDPPAPLYISPAFERIWGRPSPPDVEGVLATIHPDDRARIAALLERQEEGYDVEFRIVRPDGTIRWIHSRTFPIVDEKGSVSRVAGIDQDATERKAAEQMRDDLTDTLVHDLRNPLNSILGGMEHLELLLGPSAKDEIEMVRLAKRGGLRMLEMVNAILDVSRLEEGAMLLEKAGVNVGEVVSEVLELQQPLARPRGLRLTNKVPKDLPQAFADRALLSRVLQNLVSNAIKFTPFGGEIRVSARVCSDEPRTLEVRVADDGPGLPEEVRDRLFEKFVTGRQEERGSGLGLLFCRLAVEAQGGRIWAESPPDGGAAFTFTLPEADTE